MHVTPRSLSRPDDRVEPLGLVLRQAARRLVEHDQPRALPDGGRDLQHLLLADGQRRRRPRDVERDVDRREHRLRASPHLASARRSRGSTAGCRGTGSRRRTGSRRTTAPGGPSPRPAASASVGLSRRTGFPSNSTRPSSGAWMPARSLPSVLLPAPFSPQRAWHDPAAMSNETWSSATTPGNRFVTLSNRTAGGAAIDWHLNASRAFRARGGCARAARLETTGERFTLCQGKRGDADVVPAIPAGPALRRSFVLAHTGVHDPGRPVAGARRSWLRPPCTASSTPSSSTRFHTRTSTT